MKVNKIKISFLSFIVQGILFCMIPAISYAQGLPALPVSSQIKTGVLDNGIHYYLVNNNLDKGVVSMALVQRTGTADEEEAILGQTIVNSRGALTDLPRFSATSPFEFMNRKSLFPGKNGYVTVKDNATIYRFDKIVTANNKDAIDSTLLMIFDIISCTTAQSNRYPTSSQAIIISGEIDQNAYLNKMNMLALLVPKKGNDKSEKPYQWREFDKRVFYLIPAVNKGHATLFLEYSAPRTPREGMNTVQSLTSGKLANEMNIVIRNRISYEMRKKNIPCSVINTSYESSAWSDKDEKIRITISTKDDYLDQTMAVVASVLADLDKNGSDVQEYKDVQNEFKIGLGEVYDHIVRLNSNFVDRCISAFLYNAPLSSSQYNYDFFYKRVLDPDVELSFFNNYMRSILHPEKNLRIIVSSDIEKEKGLKLEHTFASSWERQQTHRPNRLSFNEGADELRKSFSKVKVKVETLEPMTGGKIWTFSNGMRVVYKQTGKEGYFHYEFLAKTGFSQATNIQNAEKSYLSDIIGLNLIAGLHGQDFKNMLNANGIMMKTEVSISDMTIRGTAPDTELDLVLKSLLAIGYDRKPNLEGFSYYKDCAAMQVSYFKDSKLGRMAVLDSMICPSMSHSSFRREVEMQEDFLIRANRFYDTVFSRACDGLLILVGNMPEEEVKKTLCRYIGGFHSDNSSNYRSRRQNDCNPGRSILMKEGSSSSLDLMFDTAINYTAENYMHIKLAAMAMRDALAKVAASMGWTLEDVGRFVMFPDEKFNYTLQLEPVNPDGLPASMAQIRNVDKLKEAIIAEIDRLGAKGLDPGLFNMYKFHLTSIVDEDMADPNLIQDFLIMRYSYGKDLMTKYKDKIKALNIAKVNAYLSDMAKGSLAILGVKSVDWENSINEAVIKKPVLPKSAPVRPSTDTLGINKLYRSLFQK